jgi:hypothetical protein
MYIHIHFVQALDDEGWMHSGDLCTQDSGTFAFHTRECRLCFAKPSGIIFMILN